jgi:uncharacterized coiled-coil DUF342 family protein
MNKERRKLINEQWHKVEAIRVKLDELKAEAEEAKEALEAIRDDEQEAFDNMPEGLQQSDRGQASEEAINHLFTAIDALDELDDAPDFTEALEALDNAEHG